MDNSLIVVLIVVGILVAGALGWFVGSRPAAEFKARLAKAESAAEEREGEFKVAIKELSDARIEIGKLQEREASFDKQIAAMKEAKDDLLVQFKATGAEVLKANQEEFLRRADERFKQSEEAGEAKIKALLNPVRETLGRYEKNLSDMEKDRVGSYRELRQAVETLNKSNVGVEKEARRLADVMSASPKFRGKWGEQHLQRILESTGLQLDVDFTKEVSVEGDSGRLRPDFIVHLPGDREIVIDVKFPLVSYEKAAGEENEAERERLLDAHAKALRNYASDLGKKSYWQQFDKSPDFVVLFVPGEHFLSAAAARDTALIEDAFANNVIVASTINMLALAKVMAGMWRQETLAQNAREIHEIGRELYKRMLAMGGHISKLGKNLETATNSYNSFVGSLERNVITQAKRFEDLGVELPSDRLELPKNVEEGPNPLTKLITNEDGSKDVTE